MNYVRHFRSCDWLRMTSETHVHSLWRVFLKQIRVPVKKPWLEPFWTTARPCCKWRSRSKRTKQLVLSFFLTNILFDSQQLHHSLSWAPLTVHFPIFNLTYLGVHSRCRGKVSFHSLTSFHRGPPVPHRRDIALIFPIPWFFIPLLCRWQPAVFPQRTFSPKLSLGHICLVAGPPCPT